MTQALPDIVRTIAAFVVVLGVLVFVHEFGHYWVARLCGVRVEVFSIGFGRTLYQWTDKVGTVWKLSLLPLGGYVKLHGQERPEDVSDEVRASWIAGQTFHDKPLVSRAAVVAAGPIANFLLAAVLFMALFLAVGMPTTAPVVGEVVVGAAADKAGFLANDRIESIDGTPIANFEDITKIVAPRPNTKVDVVVVRDGARKVLPVTIGARTEGGRSFGLLGIRSGRIEYAQVGVVDALTGGFVKTWRVAAETFSGLGQILTGQRGTDELGGPLRIAQLSGEVAKYGIASLISFIAVLSVNLGLLNLMPIPVLDGGFLLLYLFEAIFRRPIPPKIQEYGFGAGFAVVIMLITFATWNDLSHFGLWRWLSGNAG